MTLQLREVAIKSVAPPSPLPLSPLRLIPQLLVAGDGVVVGCGGVVVRGAGGGPGRREGLAGERPGDLAGRTHGDLFAGFGHEDIEAEDGGGDVADGFALGIAADEEDTFRLLLGCVFKGHHGIPHGAENSLDGGAAGNVFAGGVGGQPPDNAAGAGAVGVRSPSK